MAERRAAFLLHNIPFDPVDDFMDAVPDVPPLLEEFTSSFLLPLKVIFESPLAFAGMVDAVYVRFWGTTLFAFTPQAANLVRGCTPQRFEDLLGLLFANGRILDPDTAEEVISRVDGIPALLDSLPANYQRIGCSSGSEGDGVIGVADYVASAPEDASFFFVLGEFASSKIKDHIEHHVELAKVSVTAEVGLGKILIALENKWGIL